MAAIGSHTWFTLALDVIENQEGSADMSYSVISQDRYKFVIPQSGEAILTLGISAIVAGRAFVELVSASTLAAMPDRWRFPLDDLDGHTIVQVQHVFAEGDTLTCNVYHETGSAVTFAGSLTYTRVD